MEAYIIGVCSCCFDLIHNIIAPKSPSHSLYNGAQEPRHSSGDRKESLGTSPIKSPALFLVVSCCFAVFRTQPNTDVSRWFRLDQITGYYWLPLGYKQYYRSRVKPRCWHKVRQHLQSSIISYTSVPICSAGQASLGMAWSNHCQRLVVGCERRHAHNSCDIFKGFCFGCTEFWCCYREFYDLYFAHHYIYESVDAKEKMSWIY